MSHLPATACVLAILLPLLAPAGAQIAHPPKAGEPFPPWSPGIADIHQISTGRGNSALLVFPDGTTLLVDAGAVADGRAETDPHPNGSRAPGEWIARYVKRHVPDSMAPLDYALITHFHPDHFGRLPPGSPLDRTGSYRLAGITQVGALVGIKTLIDRGWPDYRYPTPFTDSTFANYRRFLEAERARGKTVERFRTGAGDQIRLRHAPERYPSVEIRNIVGNGELWTGRGDSSRALFPPLATTPQVDWPNENMCSLGFRFSYGPFRYYTGGDVPGTPDPGLPGWHAMESELAGVIGPVQVHV
ncbi:MAG: MBL fold metallo-hydrolase [Gemmatimonadetes bacterium]|nr:MBL fold metallo-hydrolase [Gemmatimonadota bacterium]